MFENVLDEYNPSATDSAKLNLVLEYLRWCDAHQTVPSPEDFERFLKQ